MGPLECEEFTFTREEFYKVVWSRPATKIAAQLGCSDVTIAKVCKAYIIPKPPVGYWAKLQYGKKIKKVTLPQCDDPQIQSLVFRKYPKKDKPSEPPREFDQDIIDVLEKAKELPSLQVPSRLSHPHPLVQLTKNALEDCRHEERGLLGCYWHNNQYPLNVSVSRKSLCRAMCIMNAIIKRIEYLGGKVEIREGRWRKATTEVIIAGEQVGSLRLRERYNQHRLAEKSNDFFSSCMKYTPNGLLVLESGESFGGLIYCQDTAQKYRLEDRLDSVIIDFIKEAGLIRIRRRKAEAARIQREAEEIQRIKQEEELRRRREELQRKQKQEQDRVDELMRNVNGWRQSQDIRAFLEAAKKDVFQRDGKLPETGEIAEYFIWAEKQADRCDPFKPSPHSVLDESI
jgi:hypothetical protein